MFSDWFESLVDIHRDKSRLKLRSNDAESVINWLSKIVIAAIFTPVVAVTSLFAKSGFIAFANIALALGYTYNFTYRAIYGATTVTDTILTLIVLALVITAAITLTGGFFPAAWTINSLIFSSSVVATAINSLFSVKNVLIPTIKGIIELIAELISYPLERSIIDIVADLIGVKYDHNLISPVSLHQDRDRYVLNNLLRVHHRAQDGADYTCYSARFNTDDIIVYNNMQDILYVYLNKYANIFLGDIVRSTEISELEKCIYQLTCKGQDHEVLRFIHMKISFKLTKINHLRQAYTDIQNACETARTTPSIDNLRLYNEKISKYFTNPKLREARQNNLTPCADSALKAIDEKIALQDSKIKTLRMCIPEDPSSKQRIDTKLFTIS